MVKVQGVNVNFISMVAKLLTKGLFVNLSRGVDFAIETGPDSFV